MRPFPIQAEKPNINRPKHFYSRLLFQTFSEMMEIRCGSGYFAENEIFSILQIIMNQTATVIFRPIIDKFISKLVVIKIFFREAGKYM